MNVTYILVACQILTSYMIIIFLITTTCPLRHNENIIKINITKINVIS